MAIRVSYMDVEPLSWPRPDHRARDAAVPRRFGTVRGHEWSGVRLRVIGVEVFTVDECIDARGKDFLGGDAAQLVAFVELAVLPVAAGASSEASGP
jgi:hypothetical protein